MTWDARVIEDVMSVASDLNNAAARKELTPDEALWASVSHRFEDATRAALNAGANPNAVDENGYSVLMHLVRERHWESATVLIKHGAATLSLPAGVNFIPKKQALAVMAHMGNRLDEENFYGLIIPADDNQKWFVAASFDDSGYIKDDDQASIDADKILETMQKGLKEDNDERRTRGLAELEIVGWIEKPHYDSKAHQLIWSIEAKETGGKGPPPTDNAVNYNTFALGRGGFISLNLVTSTTDVGNDKKIVATLLQNLAFDEGMKYENFDPKTDKVAEYGLMALIGGIAAKKLGLFALLAAVVAKSAKLLIVVALGAAVAVKNFFKRRDPTV